MNPAARFRVNSPTIVHETIDDEAVIINLDTGNYYSLDKAGTDIWNLLESGAAVAEVIEGLTRRYEGDRMDIENAVDRLVAELQQEALIIPDRVKEPEGIKASNMQVETGMEAERPSFEIPILHKYTDMQDLLLLDPIHEVDDTGWPSVKSDSFDE